MDSLLDDLDSDSGLSMRKSVVPENEGLLRVKICSHRSSGRFSPKGLLDQKNDFRVRTLLSDFSRH